MKCFYLIRQILGSLSCAMALCIVHIVPGMAQPQAARSYISEKVLLSGGDLRVEIDRHTGILRALHHKTAGTIIRDEVSRINHLWTLSMIDQGQSVIVRPQDFIDFEIMCAAPNEAQLIWRSYKGESASAFTIAVHIRIDSLTSLSYWNIAVEGMSDMILSRVSFPQVSGLDELADGTLAVPHWMGELMRQPGQALQSSGVHSFSWTYPGLLSMQFLTLYDKEGLYLACTDTAMCAKQFAARFDQDRGMVLDIEHIPSLSPSATYKIPYSVVIGGYQGDWMTAATLYKSWAVQQDWAQQSRLKNRLIPDWVLATGLWIWNRGRSEEVLQPLYALRQQFDEPISVLWHWWHQGSYDDSFPEYLPPREGTNSFRDHITLAKKHGIHALVYMNALQWGDQTASWKKQEAARYAIKSPSGQLHTHVYNVFTNRSLTNMCVGTPFWRDWYADLADTLLRDFGLSGIYMDQACIQRECYDPTHGHPIGGGNFWAHASRQMAHEVRERGSIATALSGEGSCEAWLPSLDLFLSLQVSRERYAGDDGWEPIPLFQSVYHEYALSYGSYSSLMSPPYDEKWPQANRPDTQGLLDSIYSQQFMIEQGRSFIWGMQPMLANFTADQLLQRPQEINYLLRLARLRKQYPQYLLYGAFCRPPVILPAPLMQQITLSKLSIYAGQNEHVRTFQKDMPTVLIGAWHSADGQLGLPIVHLGSVKTQIRLDFKAQDYDLADRGNLYRSIENKKQFIGTYQNGKVYTVLELEPREALILEIEPIN